METNDVLFRLGDFMMGTVRSEWDIKILNKYKDIIEEAISKLEDCKKVDGFEDFLGNLEKGIMH